MQCSVDESARSPCLSARVPPSKPYCLGALRWVYTRDTCLGVDVRPRRQQCPHDVCPAVSDRIAQWRAAGLQQRQKQQQRQQVSSRSAAHEVPFHLGTKRHAAL